MNLIERLGGYDRAKHEFEMIKEMKPIYSGEIETNDRLLLEYRRQHNIFEQGDAVVRRWNNQVYYLIVDIDNNGQEFLIHKDKNAKFKDCKISDLVCNFTHAEPEEIAAGHRL